MADTKKKKKPDKVQRKITETFVNLRNKRVRIMSRFGYFARNTSAVLAIVTIVVSLLCVSMLTVYVGFDHADSSRRIIRSILRTTQAVFVLNILFNLLFCPRKVPNRMGRYLMSGVDFLMLLTILPWVYPHPEHPWIPILEKILYSNLFLYSCMTVYAVIQISLGVMRMMSHRGNPMLLLSASFLFFITVGALVLMMPKCTYQGINFIDSLFVSTSAVCITGLSTVDVAATFTPLGQMVLAILFQVGGLGVITFTSFFAMFFTGTTSIYNQLMVRDMVYSKSMNSLLPTLLYILFFTLAVEAVGAVFLYFAMPDSLCNGDSTRLGIAVFHSMSAFCNVGFSDIPDGMANPALMNGNQAVYVVMSVLLFAGGLGFPILVNIKDMAKEYARRLWRRVTARPVRPHPVHIFDLNTKLVLYTTITILVLGCISFFVFESNNTMRGMPLWHRIVQSVFNSLIPRSGGYTTLNPSAFMDVTLLLVLVQMWIGGSSQSMAGGIKVNTLGTIVANLRGIVMQRKGVSVFKRNIVPGSVRRANAVLTLSLITTLLFLVAIMLLEPQMPLRKVVFEVVSAVFSVGSSMGITSSLGIPSKILLCIAMFVGRVGLLSLLTGFFTERRDPSAFYPGENIIIN